MTKAEKSTLEIFCLTAFSEIKFTLFCNLFQAFIALSGKKFIQTSEVFIHVMSLMLSMPTAG